MPGDNQKQSAFVDTTSGRFLMVIAVIIKDSHMPGTLLLFQDLTELRSLQTMRRQLVGNISHELRTPLAGMKAVVETLRDGAIDDKQVALDFLDKLNHEVDSMTQLINELIELSRIESGTTKLSLEPLDINNLIKGIITRLSPQAARKQIVMSTELDGNIPVVQADKERIAQVITNLVQNAVKFTPYNGRITVTTSHTSDIVKVHISDTGIGISKEDLPHIFERFFKADKSRAAEGSGLGLAIAKHIVKAHGGEIHVASQEGKGSVFSFSLPIKIQS
jgi:two-component system phosphate regulon sensor histidine kinase PhoR